MKALKLINLAIILVLALSALPAVEPVRAQGGGELETPPGDTVPGELIVRFDDALTVKAAKARAAALAGAVGAQVAEVSGQAALLSFDPAADLTALAESVAAQVGVRRVQPNYVYSTAVQGMSETVTEPFEGLTVGAVSIDGQETGETVFIPKDQLLSMRSLVKTGVHVQSVPVQPADLMNNWGNTAIDLAIVWTNKNASPVVCLLDSGVDGGHPDLAGRVIDGYDFVNGDSIPGDDYGHGTHAAGIIAARPTNDPDSTLGISNGKVLAVKVVNYEGYGTSWDMALGIDFCANSTAKVIQTSYTTPAADPAVYEKLAYAVNIKKKLVVAAAGDESVSSYRYPAAWADPNTPTPDGTTVAAGLISVGAARYHMAPRWVDIDHDGAKETGEQLQNCATPRSNYGRWVSIVAPGESIYSTSPVSYPFYEYMKRGVPPQWASYDGTAPAAAHVAAAAARLWSINATKTAAWIKNRLISTGRSLNLAVDSYNRDPATGYAAGSFLGEMPFCWPKATYPYTASQDMTGVTYLNIASAMDRAAAVFVVVDAANGYPLPGTTVRAVSSDGVVRDTSVLSDWSTLLINLPASKQYTFQVNKIGYTRGYQTVTEPVQLPTGIVSYREDQLVAMPSDSHFRVVLNWSGAFDLNLRMTVPTVPMALVNHENPGALGAAPYARFLLASPWDSQAHTETIVAQSKGLAPYYPDRGYDVYVTIEGDDGIDMNETSAVVRVWLNGVVKKLWYKQDGCYENETVWWAGSFWKFGTATKYAFVDECLSSD